ARLTRIPSRRFFTAEQWALLEAICARLMPQPDRGDHPIVIVPWIDDKLHADRRDGTRHGNLPAPREAWRRGLHGIDRESELRFGRSFVACSPSEQDAILQAVQRGDGQDQAWQGMSAQRFFNTLVGEVVSHYYAHPAAWSEIGFGGPASPRGYARLDANQRDPWEAEER
ncbi:MAG TPA: gluconate 2-dehydrogenase subunit 3 family protein, partial [Polyangiales bacterium]|nr:gluconate 2-dehydrogenase subunit 3 family protein [Polyangiales bacterium]